ncbi:MAG: aspartyl protease family protein, partial [Bacteroidota bacterium]
NDQEEYTFVFDTGATIDLLDANVKKALGLQTIRRQTVPGASGAKTYDLIASQKLTLDDQISIKSSNMVITDLSALKDRLETNFDGILGYSLLKRYVTKIDYDAQKIDLYKKIQKVETDRYEKVPFKMYNGIDIPQFDITIKLKSGDSYEGLVLFDSGASLSLLINTPFNKKHSISKKAEKIFVTEFEDLNGSSYGEDIAIASMEFGGFLFEDMVISIANDKQGVSSYKSYLGILGAKIISRFNVILDYDNSIIYLKPNKSYNGPFEFPLHGFKLKKEEDKTIVRSINKNSYSYKEGLRIGDEIVSIDNKTFSDIERYRDLLKQEGKTVEIVYKNVEGQEKKIKLKLKRLL